MTFNASLGWTPHPTGLALWLSGGVSLAYSVRAQIKRVVTPIDSEETLWASRRALEVFEGATEVFEDEVCHICYLVMVATAMEVFEDVPYNGYQASDGLTIVWLPCANALVISISD